MLYSYLFIVYFSKYVIVLKELCFLVVTHPSTDPTAQILLTVNPLRQVPRKYSSLIDHTLTALSHRHHNSFLINSEKFMYRQDISIQTAIGTYSVKEPRSSLVFSSFPSIAPDVCM